MNILKVKSEKHYSRWLSNTCLTSGEGIRSREEKGQGSKATKKWSKMKKKKKQGKGFESLTEERFEIEKSGEWKNMDIWPINLNSNSNICSRT